MNTDISICLQGPRKNAERQKGLVIIDSAVEDYQSLKTGTLDGLDVTVLNLVQGGIEQITALLADYRNLNGLHIVSHGQPGMLLLGSGWVGSEALSQQVNSVKAWAKALAEDGEILFYGCNVAKGCIGEQFIRQFSALTGAAVAASTTKTGGAARGGNWVLEVATASTSGKLAFLPSVLRSYSAVLGSLTQYNVNTATQSSYPIDFTDINGTLYFTAQSFANSGSMPPYAPQELWKIDPVSGNSIKIDSNLQLNNYQPSYLLRIRDTLYYTTKDSTGDLALWKLDSGANTPVHLDISALAPNSSIAQLTNINNTLYFTTGDSTNGSKLWKLDSNSKAIPINFNTASIQGSIVDLTDVNGTLYFTDFEFNTRTIWKIDPLTNQPVFIGNSAISYRGNVKAFTNVNGTLYFKSSDNSSSNWSLLSVDSFSATPKLIDSVNAAVSVVSIASLTSVNGLLYFTASGLTNSDNELWRYNPSTNAVERIDVYPGTASSFPQDLMNIEGTLYFTANGSSYSYYDVPSRGRELWKVDPVTGKPVRLTDGSALDLGRYSAPLVNINGTLYFSATDSTYGPELWKLDTKTDKLELVSDINPGSNGSDPKGLRNENGVLRSSSWL